MSDWLINVNENQYRDDKYRVSVSNSESLEIVKLGVGNMGSGAYGLLPKQVAESLATDISDSINLTEYDSLTDELRAQLYQLEETHIDQYNEN